MGARGPPLNPRSLPGPGACCTISNMNYRRISRRTAVAAAALFLVGAGFLIGVADGRPQDPAAAGAAAQDGWVELHRLRIVNAKDGAIQVSTDAGQTWRLVGRVNAPATTVAEGYLAANYACLLYTSPSPRDS